MAINRTITIEWDGKAYECRVTMVLIDRIEEELNLSKMLSTLSSGDIRFSHAAKLVAFLLRDAGAEVTQEEVYQGLFAGDDGLDSREIGAVIGEIMMAIFPEPPKKPKAKPKKKTSQKRSRGKTTTK